VMGVSVWGIHRYQLTLLLDSFIPVHSILSHD
jgi:hypothetical protein